MRKRLHFFAGYDIIISINIGGAVVFCRQCGKEVKETDNFCGNCGFRVNAPTNNGQSASNRNTNPEKVRIISTEEPLFRVKCEYCRCEFEYRLANLGYRIWYPSGFVYCPKCNKPLRHRLEYEVK